MGDRLFGEPPDEDRVRQIDEEIERRRASLPEGLARCPRCRALVDDDSLGHEVGCRHGLSPKARRRRAAAIDAALREEDADRSTPRAGLGNLYRREL